MFIRLISGRPSTDITSQDAAQHLGITVDKKSPAHDGAAA